MGELEDSGFSDLTIDGAAIRAGLAFPGLRIDLLAYLSALEVVDIRPTKLLQELSALWFREQNSGASFTDFLQNRNDELEIADVECWQSEANMSEVTIAVLQSFTAGLASSGFAGDTLFTASVYLFEYARSATRPYQSWIDGAVGHRTAVLLNIIQQAIRDLEHSLVHNVASRPDQLASVSSVDEGRITYWIPNLSSLNLFGILSTTCSFTAGPLGRDILGVLLHTSWLGQ